MLDKYVPVAETSYVEQPDGVALPGECHLRYVLPTDVPKLFARAAEIRETGRHVTDSGLDARFVRRTF